jgi:hypothetical protein
MKIVFCLNIMIILIKTVNMSTEYHFNPETKFKYTKDNNGKFHSYNDKPAIDYYDGSEIKIWMKHGLMHRDTLDDNNNPLPALITKDKQEYYKMGKMFNLSTSSNKSDYYNNEPIELIKSCMFDMVKKHSCTDIKYKFTNYSNKYLDKNNKIIYNSNLTDNYYTWETPKEIMREIPYNLRSGYNINKWNNKETVPFVYFINNEIKLENFRCYPKINEGKEYGFDKFKELFYCK